MQTTIEQESEEPKQQPEQKEQKEQKENRQPNKKQVKGEKKWRKAMQRLGLKNVQGITRVTIKKPKEILLYIDDPQVMVNPGTNSYVVFGDAKFQDFNQNLESVAERFKDKQPAPENEPEDGDEEKELSGDDKDEEEDPLINPETKEEGEEGGEGGEEEDEKEKEEAEEEIELKEDDIEIVMSHTSCTREEAIKALQKAGGDSVQVILAMTK